MERDSASSVKPCSSYVAAGRSVFRDSNDGVGDCTRSGDSSCIRYQVERHPLRFDRDKNTSRLTAHIHPLRLVHSKYLYPRSAGKYVCDIGHHEPGVSGYVFNCPLCEFDICLECVAQPCFNCEKTDCRHTNISIKLV